ncbi:hypothetical protein BMS3Bbin10_00749 [bacterium BMS3Bbin10]|nr:hypothetical protein BMS3Bbin10_00749 [bacterium BMS3Bbin10]
MTDFTTASAELSLQEMLADPIVQTMMARDGVTRQEVEGLMEAMREGTAGRRVAGHETGRHGFSPLAFEGLRRRERMAKREERRLQWKR